MIGEGEPLQTDGPSKFEQAKEAVQTATEDVKTTSRAIRDVIDAGPNDWGPLWSPNGTRIAFTTGYESNTDVAIANADGTGVRLLTPETPGSDFSLWWSPDGSKILFGSDRSRTGGTFIYMMDPDGGNVQLVKRI
jgi:TolB protein